MNTEIHEVPAQTNSKDCIAPLWRRFLAFSLDLLLLGLPLWGLGMALYQQASSLGEWGRLVGVVVVTLYFTYFDSAFGNGRSLGKRLLRIKVRRLDDTFLSPSAAAFRSLVLTIPLILNGLYIESDPESSRTVIYLYSMMSSMLVFGLGGSLIYLFIFNRSRRSLHDLVTKSIVLRNSSSLFDVHPLWKGHLVVTIILLIVSTVLPLAASLAINEQTFPGLKGMESIQSSLRKLPEVGSVQVLKTTTLTKTNNGENTKNAFVFTIVLKHELSNKDEFIRNVEDALFVFHKDMIGSVPVHVVLRHGFNLGIASYYKTSMHSTSLGDWRAHQKGLSGENLKAL